MSWQVQSDEPLFADLLWDQPQTKAQQPRLLVIGGREQSLAGPLDLYQQLASCSRLKIAVPDVWQKKLPQPPAEVVFCPSNQSGSLAGRGLDQLLALAASAEAVIIGGSIGANDETRRLIGQLLERIDQPTIVTDEALKAWPAGDLGRPNQIVVPDTVGLHQLLQPWCPAGKNAANLDRTQLMDLLAEKDLEQLNLAVISANTIWVKVAKNMCYNMLSSGGSTQPQPLELAGWTTWFAARSPKNLFAAAASASHQTSGN